MTHRWRFIIHPNISHKPTIIQKKKNPTDHTPLVVTYNPALESIQEINQLQSILEEYLTFSLPSPWLSSLGQLIPNKPPTDQRTLQIELNLVRTKARLVNTSLPPP